MILMNIQVQSGAAGFLPRRFFTLRVVKFWLKIVAEDIQNT